MKRARRPRGLLRLIKMAAAAAFATSLMFSLLSTGNATAQQAAGASFGHHSATSVDSTSGDGWAASDDCQQLTEKIRHHEIRDRPQAACISFGVTSSTSAEVRSSDALSAPSWCGVRSYKYTRTGACGVSSGDLKVYNTRTGALVGGATWNGLVYVFTDATSTNWKLEMTLSGFKFWGTWVRGTTFRATGYCSGDCTTGRQSWPTQLITEGATYKGYVSGDSTATASGAIGSGKLGVTVTATNPLWRAPTISGGNGPAVRCDNALSGRRAGCVFNTVTPEMTYSLSAPYPQLAAHIRDAQASGLPGGTAGRPLHRTTDPILQLKNNQTACPRSVPRPLGKDCDEYPFKSTYEGAANNPYSIRMIDSAQNQAGGSALGTFYADNRVLDHDPFTVVIAP